MDNSHNQEVGTFIYVFESFESCMKKLGGVFTIKNALDSVTLVKLSDMFIQICNILWNLKIAKLKRCQQKGVYSKCLGDRLGV